MGYIKDEIGISALTTLLRCNQPLSLGLCGLCGCFKLYRVVAAEPLGALFGTVSYGVRALTLCIDYF